MHGKWSFKTIEENIPAIAEAGYTSVQTEPISAIHSGGKGMIFTENWYYVYQPANTSIGNFVVGSEDDLKAMTVAAHAMASASSSTLWPTTSPPTGTPSTPTGRRANISMRATPAAAPAATTSIIPTVGR